MMRAFLARWRLRRAARVLAKAQAATAREQHDLVLAKARALRSDLGLGEKVRVYL